MNNKTIDTWEERFDEVGFGNQARIVGVKRVELKDFISKEIELARQQGYQAGQEDMGEEMVIKVENYYKMCAKLRTEPDLERLVLELNSRILPSLTSKESKEDVEGKNE